MHYLTYFTILLLLLPLLFVSTITSTPALGVGESSNIITPSNSICCKNETSFSSQPPSSVPVTSPLKKISSLEENPKIQADESNTDSPTSTELSSTPDSSTSTVASPLDRTNDENIEDSTNSLPTRVTTQLDDDDNSGSNLSDMIQNNLDKLLYSDFPVETSSDESNSDESSLKLEELQSMMRGVFS